MRGGDKNETLVIFDGLPLYEPFHLRLLQSPTSVLDERILDGIDVYAGGFTAEFGDRMSAVIERARCAPSGRALRTRPEPVSRECARGAVRGRPRPVARLGPSQQPRRDRGPHGPTSASRATSTALPGSTTRCRPTRAAACRCCSPTTRPRSRTRPAPNMRPPSTERLRLGHARARLVRTIGGDGDPFVHGRVDRTRSRSRRARQAQRRGRRRARLRRARPQGRRELRNRPLAAAFGRRSAQTRSHLRLHGQRRVRAGLPVPGRRAQAISRALAPNPSGDHFSAYFTVRGRLTER